MPALDRPDPDPPTRGKRGEAVADELRAGSRTRLLAHEQALTDEQVAQVRRDARSADLAPAAGRVRPSADRATDDRRRGPGAGAVCDRRDAVAGRPLRRRRAMAPPSRATACWCRARPPAEYPAAEPARTPGRPGSRPAQRVAGETPSASWASTAAL